VIGNSAASFLKNVSDDCWILERREAPLQAWSKIAQHSLDVRGKWPAAVVDEIGSREMIHALATPAPSDVTTTGTNPLWPVYVSKIAGRAGVRFCRKTAFNRAAHDDYRTVRRRIRMSRKCRLVLARVGVLALTAIVLLPSSALAQSPWERAANNLALSFTGPLARALALVAIVIGGLMFMFGEGGAKRQISGIVFGGGLALFAGQFLTWLF
jgi:type IV secretory pathway VirB2 component (pilin)